MRWQNFQKWAFIIFLIILVVGTISFYFFSDTLELKDIETEIKSFGIWAPIIFILLYIILTAFLPSTPFMAIAGIFFGFKNGFIYVAIGSFLGAIFVFWISRTLGRSWVETFLKKEYLRRLDNYNKRLENGAILDLILLRMVPMPFNVLNVLMGISRVGIQDYALGSILGLIPSNLITVYAGTFLTKIF